MPNLISANNYDIEAKSLNKVVANINRFTVVIMIDQKNDDCHSLTWEDVGKSVFSLVTLISSNIKV